MASHCSPRWGLRTTPSGSTMPAETASFRPEGDAFGTMFSWDGRKLYYQMQSGENGADLWSRELETGKTERVVSSSAILPGSAIGHYSVSHDGKQVAISMRD